MLRRNDDRRGAPPWIVAEITSQDPQALISRINAISGYMRIGLVDVQPPFKELTDIGFSGPVNPNIKLLDMDGEGTLDITADIDVPSLQGGDPIASIFISFRFRPGFPRSSCISRSSVKRSQYFL